MNKTNIEWSDFVWNVVTGCSKVSKGCENCYAETYANRFWGDRKFTDIQCHENKLGEPLKVKKPCKIFVNSMSDLFHESVPFEFIDKVFAVMSLCPQHTFQVLTKRPERMREYFENLRNDSDFDIFGRLTDRIGFALSNKLSDDQIEDIAMMDDTHDWPLPNVWLGVSVEDQKTADKRIPFLLDTPAAVRFISAEPLLDEVDFDPYIMGFQDGEEGGRTVRLQSPPINWIIVGGESGSKARPMETDWARSIRDQCIEAGIPFFMKQMAKKAVIPADLFIREFPE